MAPYEGLRVSLRHQRRSPALSESSSSELSELSRSPSPPPSLLRALADAAEEPSSEESCSDTSDTESDTDGKRQCLLHKRADSAIADVDLGPPRKKARKGSKVASKAQTQTRIAFPVIKGSRRQLFLSEGRQATPLGKLSKLPPEIRNMIYEIALNVDQPVEVKQCCGPDTTHRERAMCKKHSAGRSKSSRFNVLMLSMHIYLEASSILYTKGKLRLAISPGLTPYFMGFSQKTRYRLNNSPGDRRVQAMWKSVAKFRVVILMIDGGQFRAEDPVVYTARLVDAVSLLFKGWREDADRASSALPHTVTVDLDSLFDETLPFNTDDLGNPDEPVMVPLDHPHHSEFPHILAAQTNTNLKKLISIIERHRGESRWFIKALSHLADESEGGVKNLKAFRQSCWKSGVWFEGKELES